MEKFKVINKAMKMTATNMTYSISLEVWIILKVIPSKMYMKMTAFFVKLLKFQDLSVQIVT